MIDNYQPTPPPAEYVPPAPPVIHAVVHQQPGLSHYQTGHIVGRILMIIFGVMLVLALIVAVFLVLDQRSALRQVTQANAELTQQNEQLRQDNARLTADYNRAQADLAAARNQAQAAQSQAQLAARAPQAVPTPAHPTATAVGCMLGRYVGLPCRGALRCWTECVKLSES